MLWKAIETDSEYEVSDTGLVRKIHYQKQWEDRDGYLHCSVKLNGKQKQPSVHRLVLHTFDPRTNEDELEVHHIDGNPKNNNLDNLMWCSHEENISFISVEKRAIGQFISQPVEQLTLEGELIASFSSLKEAERKTGCSYKHIGDVCRGNRQTTGGYKWRYFEGSTTNSSECCETESTYSEDIVCSSLKNEAVEDTHMD